MNKPDWNDAPEWAMWLAQDSYPDGMWVWFEEEPTFIDGGWIQDAGTDWLQTEHEATEQHAENTLEPRP